VTVRAVMSCVGAVLMAALLVAASGGCAAGQGSYTRAFKERAAANMDRVKAGTEWDMARQRFLAGDLEKALAGVEESIELAPGVAKSHLLKGRVLMEMGALDGALRSFERASELDPAGASAWYYRGLVRERWGAYGEALDCFLAAAERDDTDPQYTVAAAEMLISLDRLAEADGVLDEAAAHFEHNAGVRQTRGHLAMMRGDAAAAIGHFEAACLLAPDEEGLIEDLARAQIAAGRFAEAEYSLSRVLRGKAGGGGASDGAGGVGRRDLMHLRARCLLETDRPMEARRVYETLTEGEGGASDADAWIGLGRSALMLGNEPLARESGASAARIAPERAEGWLIRATALARTGAGSRALGVLRDAERAVSDASAVLTLRASMLEAAGDREGALASALSALERRPGLEAARSIAERLGGEVPDQTPAVVGIPVAPDG
jgi:tetratricopeptide (TPR) repeat protein